MNKTLIVAAVSLLAAGGALAQSTVTLYGRLNTSGERWDSNGKKTYQLANNSSRWGLLGVEDMGGGLKAGFNLESGFDSSTGQASAVYFGRQAFVYLSGGFGMVKLGNSQSEAYYATADYVSLHNHDTGTSADALYAFGIGSRANKISYRLPTFVTGLQVEGGVAAGEGANNVTRSYDGAINYTLGPLALGAGYTKENQAEQYAIRAAYTLGGFVVGGYVEHDKNGFANPALPATPGRFAFTTSGKRTTYRVSGMYALGASEFHLNFGSAGRYSNIANSSAKQYTVAYNYNLSKRTKLYTYYTAVKDSAANVYNSANFGIAKTGADTKFSSIAFGLRHNF